MAEEQTRILPNACAFCAHVNPAGSRFCNECGASMALTLCAQCEAINNRSAPQCHKCKAPLAATVEVPSIGGPRARLAPSHTTFMAMLVAIVAVAVGFAYLTIKAPTPPVEAVDTAPVAVEEPPAPAIAVEPPKAEAEPMPVAPPPPAVRPAASKAATAPATRNARDARAKAQARVACGPQAILLGVCKRPPANQARTR